MSSTQIRSLGLVSTAFKMGRMSQARELLEAGAFDRSSVKQAALGVGLTDLGRFSVEYKALFGHSPSETLSPAQPALFQDH